jgi:hypothetical protein
MSTTKHIPAVIASCLCRGHTSFAKQAAHLTNYACPLSKHQDEVPNEIQLHLPRHLSVYRKSPAKWPRRDRHEMV